MGAFCLVFSPKGASLPLDAQLRQRASSVLQERSPGAVSEWENQTVWAAMSGSDASILEGDSKSSPSPLILDGRPEGDPKQSGEALLKALVALSAGGIEREEVARARLGTFSGSFSGCYFDGTCGRLLLFRDRFGSRPLFFAQHGERFLVASDCKVFRALGLRFGIEPTALREGLQFRYSSREPHILSPIRQVLPGGLVEKSPGRPHKAFRSWQIRFDPDPTDNRDIDDYADAMDGALRSSLRDINGRGHKFGLLLSGGVDSSLLAALGREELSSLTAFVGSLPEFHNLEEGRARKVAESLGIDCRVVEIDPRRFPEDLSQMVRRLEGLPRNPNNLVLQQLLESASQEVDVVIQGDGVDTLFGMGFFKTMQNVNRKQALLGWIPSAVKRSCAGVFERFPYPLSTRIAKLLAWDDFHYARTFDLLGYCPAVRNTLGLSIVDVAGWGLDPRPHLENAEDYRRTLLLDTFVHESLLRHDRTAQPLGLQSLAPFFWAEVIDVAMRMPRELKFQEVSKPVLRALCDRYLPSEVSRWSKGSFEVPWETWLREELAPVKEEAMAEMVTSPYLPPGFVDSAVRNNDGEGLWTTLTLYLLMREFDVDSQVPGDFAQGALHPHSG